VSERLVAGGEEDDEGVAAELVDLWRMLAFPQGAVSSFLGLACLTYSVIMTLYVESASPPGPEPECRTLVAA
jgi:hypothetical protein